MFSDEKSITSFSGDFRWLSNFWPSPMMHEGISYTSVENAYQAYKTEDMVLRREIAEMSPGQAKRAGKKIKIRENWERLKLEGMTTLLQYKFWPGRELMWKLTDTENVWIIEGNTWGDKYWGAVMGKTGLWEGQNHLGHLLMNIRQSRLEEIIPEFPTYESMEYWRGK